MGNGLSARHLPIGTGTNLHGPRPDLYNTSMPNTPDPRPADAVFPGANRVEAIALGFCVSAPFGCGQPVTGFDDPVSEREFGISGLCQTCQNDIFG